MYNTVSSTMLGATDQSGLIEGYNRTNEVIELIGHGMSLPDKIDLRVTSAFSSGSGRAEDPRRAALDDTADQRSWVRGRFQRSMSAMTADIKHGKRAQARAQAGRAQIADLLVITLEQADQVKSHFSTDFATDATLTTPLTEATLALLRAQTTAGKVTSAGTTFTLPKSARAHALKQLDGLAGQTPLAIMGGALAAPAESKLLHALESLQALGATDYRSA